jgi:hypothetical protein
LPKTNTISKFEEFRAWSLLTDKPVLFLDSDSHEYFVFWGGLRLHRLVGLALAAAWLTNIYSTKSMLYSLKRYGINSAGELTMLAGKLEKILKRCKAENYSAAEILSWFDLRNASEPAQNE